MGAVKDESAATDAAVGFAVGATLVARWMGQTERTCVVVDRREFLLGILSFACVNRLHWGRELGVLSGDRVKYYVHWHDVRHSSVRNRLTQY